MIITSDDKRYDLFYKNKNVTEFSEITPNGNNINGLLLRSHDAMHGSLLITNVNGEDIIQFVQGFPKIQKYIGQNLSTMEMPLYEKLDGTCICYYKLYDSNNNLIELVPKTRQSAVAEESFIELLKYCYLDKLETTNYGFECIYLELYGILNPHTIYHADTGINVALIGAYNSDFGFFNNEQLKDLSNKLLISQPLCHGVIYAPNEEYQRSTYIFVPNRLLYPDALKDIPLLFNSMEEVILSINQYLDNINSYYEKKIGKIKYEGLVIRNDNRYIKVKPESFLKLSGIISNIDKQEIYKEIKKVFTTRLDLFEDYDEKEVIEEVNTNLLEEYPREDVYNHRVQREIKKNIHNRINHLPGNDLMTIINKLAQYPEDMSLNELLKIFAQENPMLKHESQKVYATLKNMREN